jgi:hypothetical protein
MGAERRVTPAAETQRMVALAIMALRDQASRQRRRTVSTHIPTADRHGDLLPQLSGRPELREASATQAAVSPPGRRDA